MTGFLNIIKPTGSSSTYVVSKIKKILKQKRVGHLGTLDPAASGVLPIAVGKATKFFDYFLSKDKIYYAIAEFGVETNTLDSEGEIVARKDANISLEMIKKILPNFIGNISQIPPIFSALKIDGKPAYELAREGVSVQVKSREVNIFSIDVLEEIDKNIFAFRICCSAGTYIRSLLSDIAKSLGTIANIPVIIREKSGVFHISKACTLCDCEKDVEPLLIKIEDVFSNLKQIKFNKQDALKVKNGVVINNNYGLEHEQEFLGYIDEQLFGLFEFNDNQIKCKINVYEGDV